MTRKELKALRGKLAEQKKKTADMDILVTALLALPKGQLKKLLSEDVLAVLEKYGYTGAK